MQLALMRLALTEALLSTPKTRTMLTFKNMNNIHVCQVIVLKQVPQANFLNPNHHANHSN
jgi:hypothetical protein